MPDPSHIPTALSLDPLARLAERQTWIHEDVESAAQQAIREAFEPLGASAQAARNALHGTWLHEPLHAVITDIPVGAWSAAALFDLLAAASSSEKLDHAADACVLLGLAGAAGAAITGMNDWAEIKDKAPRRIGSVHALLNVAATLLFGASAIARRKPRQRGVARVLGLAGIAVVSASAHLGGNLVYEHGIGVQGKQQEG